MATSKIPLSSMKTLWGDKKPTPLTEAQLTQFGNYGGGDVKTKSAYLSKLGLIGADQLLTDHPDISSSKGIINAQSDWKTSAISAMLIRARQAGLKTPTEIKANREALTSALAPRLKEAINHPVFNQLHPNFWSVFDSVLKDQYASENVPTPTPALATALAKK